MGLFSRQQTAWLGVTTAAVISIGALSASAATINYGSFSGADVLYTNVTESSGTDGLPLYNIPSVLGNDLSFSPTGFASFASNGSADITDGQISFIIQSSNGLGITQLSGTEIGSYTLGGSGTDLTSASVGQIFVIKILDIDNVPLTTSQRNSLTFTVNSTFQPNGGSFNLADNGTTLASAWSGSFSFDIASAIAQSDLGQYATRISVSSNNTLLTTSEAGTVSFIDKKDLEFSTTVVPEPASLGLLGGIALLALRRRRA